MRELLILTLCLGAFASSVSVLATVGSTVSVSVQTIVSYTSFNIIPYNTTTYASFVASDATATTFACLRECFTGIAAFPTFPFCSGFDTRPKLVTLGPTSVAFSSIAPLSNNQGSGTWLFSEGCRAQNASGMICKVEQTGPSYLMSNPFPTGAERSALEYTGTSVQFPPPMTTTGVTRAPTGTGITSQTSTFTVRSTDISHQFLVVIAGLETNTTTTSGAVTGVSLGSINPRQFIAIVLLISMGSLLLG